MSTATAPVETPLPQSKPIVSWRATLGIVSLLLAFAPVLWRYVSAVLNLPHYEFVMLLPIGAAVLAVPRWGQLGALAPGRGVPFFIWMGSGCLLLAASVVLDSPWLGAIASLLAVAGAIYAVGGRKLLLVLLPAWCLLWLGIRLPLTADTRLSQNLQKIAAQRASSVMNFIGEDHILDGNVVETPYRRYMVEEACSGVQSLFAITACTVFFALWMREPVGRVILLLMAAWWWVWVANVARVILVTVLDSRWGLPVVDGWGHTALGIVLFSLTLGLIVSSEHLLLFVLPRGIFSGKEDLVIDPHEVKPGPTQLPALGQTWLASIPLVTMCLGLALLQWLPQLNMPAPTATPVSLDGLQYSLAPTSFNGWTLLPDLPDVEGDNIGDGAMTEGDGYAKTQRRADSQFGARSHTWQYAKGPKRMMVSIDYPFRGWHELTICYVTSGWDIDHRKVVEVPRTAGSLVREGEKCVTTVMQRRQDSDYGYLVFTSFNDRQEPIPVAENLSVYQRLVDRISAFWVRLQTLGRAGGSRDDQVQSFQVQVFIKGQVPTAQSDSDDAMALFAEFRNRLGHILMQSPATGAKP